MDFPAGLYCEPQRRVTSTLGNPCPNVGPLPSHPDLVAQGVVSQRSWNFCVNAPYQPSSKKEAEFGSLTLERERFAPNQHISDWPGDHFYIIQKPVLTVLLLNTGTFGK